MKTKKYILLLGIAISIFFSSCEKAEDLTPIQNCYIDDNTEHPKALNYQRFMDQFLEVGAPGVSITVRSPEGVWSKGGGKADLKNNIDLSPCNSLRAGSASKLFASTTILMLQEEEYLSIDDKINEYIPSSITNKIKNANDVTIKQLLNMTSGIREYAGFNSYLNVLNLTDKRLSAEENLKYIYNKSARFGPGDEIYYTNSNYLLVALVIKYATGKAANEIVQEKIIDKYDLSNTYITTATPENLSRCYYDEYDKGIMHDVTEIDNNAVGGEDMLDGGIISSSYDLSRFLELLLSGQIISESSLNQMKGFIDITQDLGDIEIMKKYGLGLMEFETNDGIAYGHYGTVYANQCFVLHFPEHDVTVSTMVNGMSNDIDKLMYRKDLFSPLFE